MKVSFVELGMSMGKNHLNRLRNGCVIVILHQIYMQSGWDSIILDFY